MAVRLVPAAASLAKGKTAIGMRLAPAPVISIESCAPAGPAARQKITLRRKRIVGLFVMRTESKFQLAREKRVVLCRRRQRQGRGLQDRALHGGVIRRIAAALQDPG